MKIETIKRDEFFGMLPNISTVYSTDKGRISLLSPCRATFDSFEIYCLEGYLFDDIERYDTLEEAEARIKELLTINNRYETE
tara:strand:- start:1426 stop:1671 length:246 start_codon:yes stop_codon:yes gene_type:complete